MDEQHLAVRGFINKSKTQTFNNGPDSNTPPPESDTDPRLQGKRSGPLHRSSKAKGTIDLITFYSDLKINNNNPPLHHTQGFLAARSLPSTSSEYYHEMGSLIPRSAFSASASAHSLLLRQRAAPWTCRSCSQTTQQNISQSLRARKANFSTSQHAYSQAGKRAWREKMKNPRERRRVAIVATLVFLAGAGALAFSEKARHTYIACERSGRVGVTLAICVNE